MKKELGGIVTCKECKERFHTTVAHNCKERYKNLDRSRQKHTSSHDEAIIEELRKLLEEDEGLA